MQACPALRPDPSQVSEDTWLGGACGWGLLDTHICAPPHPQSLLAMSPKKRKLAAQEGRPTEAPPEEQPEENLHTLEEFSYEFFRCTPYSIPGPAPTSPSVLPGDSGP